VIGFLRALGLLNAAVWFGAAVFFSLVALPAIQSEETRTLLGPKNFPFFSVALGQILAGRFFYLFSACSIVAVLHLVAEWLYLGRIPRRIWVGVLLTLFAIGIVSGSWLLPNLRESNVARHRAGVRPEQQEAAETAYATAATIFRLLNIALILGLGAYVWKVGNPPISTRFNSTSKFRS
jgi:hypothetical protein